MSCASLATTGSPVLALVATGGLLLIAGAVLLRLTRGRGGRAAATVVLLLLIGGVLVPNPASWSVARAATPTCTPTPDPTTPSSGSGSTVAHSLTITQTSPLSGLAPGVGPLAITGRVTNRGTTSTLVTTVRVSIAAVTKASGAYGGTCDASDYFLVDAAMPVRQTIGVGESVEFAGARIGFRDKAVNQNACQNAEISLRYVSS